MKKILLKLVGSSLLAIQMSPSSLMASVHCEKPKAGAVSNQERLYSFSTSIICHIKDAQGDIAKIKEEYVDFFRSNSNFTVYDQKNKVVYQRKPGLSGSLVNVFENRRTKHGDLNIQFQTYLVDNVKDQFIYDAQSSRLEATGNAENTEFEGQLVEVAKKGQGDYDAKITLYTRIKKPRIAPSGIFKSRVIEGMNENLVVLGNKHAAIIEKGLQ